jgi:hypothetical protein
LAGERRQPYGGETFDRNRGRLAVVRVPINQRHHDELRVANGDLILIGRRIAATADQAVDCIRRLCRVALGTGKSPRVRVVIGIGPIAVALPIAARLERPTMRLKNTGMSVRLSWTWTLWAPAGTPATPVAGELILVM